MESNETGSQALSLQAVVKRAKDTQRERELFYEFLFLWPAMSEKKLDKLAAQEMQFRWQYPASFANRVTTDPLHQANEPLEQEDLVSGILKQTFGSFAEPK